METLEEYFKENEIRFVNGMFCVNCGSLLSNDSSTKKEINDGLDFEDELNEDFLYCGNCDVHYISEDLSQEVGKIEFKREGDESPGKRIIEDSKDSFITPACPSCGSNEAYLKNLIPPLFGDEDETIIYECTSCGKVYRESSMKTS